MFGVSAPSPGADAGGLDLGDAEPNWAAFAVQQYLEALLASPLVVVETLTDVQFQKRIDSPYERLWRPTTVQPTTSYSSYESVPLSGSGRVVPMHLPRMHSDISGNLRTITDSELEGLSGLLKGHLTDFCFRASFAVIQPGIEEFMNDMLDVFEDVNPTTNILSHAITGAVLSPLELVRSRLIVQASSSSRRRYFGPIHALYSIANEERPSPSSSAFSTLYTPRVLIPSILVHSVGPFVRFFSARIIQDELGLDAAFTPVLYRLATLGFLAIEAAIVTPIEMARKRLQVQRLDAFRQSPNHAASPHATRTQAFDSVVETSATPYTGMLNCIGCIVAEEGGRRPVKRRQHMGGNLSSAEWQDVYGGGGGEKPATGVVESLGRLAKGISTLYRGFWARYAATVILYASSEIAREDGW
ncbi:hypothetical protein HK105_201934 [Polyrhizophydium stewartii]|uniref:Mitochondrial carrier n=1 Tax=Polyrhizophydium stewartii TaxID=2732419 RepID=A0ABR4NG78_9FUNG